jgi:hypothetical protein
MWPFASFLFLPSNAFFLNFRSPLDVLYRSSSAAPSVAIRCAIIFSQLPNL